MAIDTGRYTSIMPRGNQKPLQSGPQSEQPLTAVLSLGPEAVMNRCVDKSVDNLWFVRPRTKIRKGAHDGFGR
jgi:hypothetical protein